jgi:hypothetical protein
MRRTTRRREDLQSIETGGFRFALTLLVALGTIIYVLYNYLQNNAVDSQTYSLICGAIFFALILAIGFLFYLLIKGYSLEVHDNPNLQKRLKNLASDIYLSVFLMSVILLIIMAIFFLVNLFIKDKTLEISLSLVVVVLLILVALILIAVRRRSEKLLDIAMIIDLAVLSFIIVIGLLILSNLFVFPPLQGHVVVDMDSIYYKSATPLPVLIRTTGLSTNITVFLIFESNHTLIIKDKIMLEPEYPSFNTSSSKYLLGNTLEDGRYTVFINTTNLTEGYYELHCLRGLILEPFTKDFTFESSSAQNFQLVNSSQ